MIGKKVTCTREIGEVKETISGVVMEGIKDKTKNIVAIWVDCGDFCIKRIDLDSWDVKFEE